MRATGLTSATPPRALNLPCMTRSVLRRPVERDTRSHAGGSALDRLRSAIAAMAATGQHVALCLAFEAGAGHVLQQHLAVDRQQGAFECACSPRRRSRPSGQSTVPARGPNFFKRRSASAPPRLPGWKAMLDSSAQRYPWPTRFRAASMVGTRGHDPVSRPRIRRTSRAADRREPGKANHGGSTNRRVVVLAICMMQHMPQICMKRHLQQRSLLPISVGTIAMPWRFSPRCR